jgi:tetratricopeptide (TPR) repeat protein
MPTYAWTARDKSGARVFHEIEAASVQQSRDFLLAAGCTDLELQEDEILAQTNIAMGDKAEFLGEEIKVTAKDRVQFRNRSVTSILLQSLRQDLPFFLVVGAGLAYSLYQHFLTSSIVCAALLIGWPLIKIGLGLPLILFKRLADARDWNRDDEILRLINQLRLINRYHFAKIPETELTRAEAYTLARQGRLSDALQLFNRIQNQPGVPPWLFKAQLAGVYDYARDYETAIKLTEEAIALKPDAILYIDYSSRLARRREDAAAARAALEHVDMSLVVAISRPSVTRLRGIIAWLERDFETARRELEAAIAAMEKTRHVPFRTGNIAITKGYLCCVHAKLGNREAARKCWDEARAYLIATKETKLIKDCEEALANG